MNGVAERVNRTLLDMVRTMSETAKLPNKFWAEALATACYLKNRVMHSAIDNNTPEGIWTGSIPSVKHLKVYGYLAYAHIPKNNRQKLNNRAKECILVGYSSQTKGYRLWDLSTNDVIQTKHVTFDENISGYQHIYRKTNHDMVTIIQYDEDQVRLERNDNRDNVDQNSDIDDDERQTVDSTNEISEEDIESHNLRSGRSYSADETRETQKDKIIRNPWVKAGKPKNLEINLLEIIEPRTYDEALESPQCREWIEAMKEELGSLEDRNTWEIVRKSNNEKCIGCRWVYKVKSDSNGNIVRYKARLVAQGYKQIKDIDYTESYAPVARIEVIRLMLAIAVSNAWEVHHLDVKCAYLYGDLAEDVYMNLPQGYDRPCGDILKLKRPIYGLKQSGRNWNNEIDRYLTNSGFVRLKCSNCMYAYNNETILVIYVDDIVIFAKNACSMNEVKKLIMSKYEIKDLGAVSYLLGIKIERKNDCMALSQTKYIDKLLNEFNMNNCKSVKTPIEVGVQITKEDSPETQDDRHSYSGVVVTMNGNAIVWKCNKQESLSTSTMEAEYVALAGAVKEIMYLEMMFDELKNVTDIIVPCKPYVVRCDNMSTIEFTKNRIERSRTKHISICQGKIRRRFDKTQTYRIW